MFIPFCKKPVSSGHKRKGEYLFFRLSTYAIVAAISLTAQDIVNAASSPGGIIQGSIYYSSNGRYGGSTIGSTTTRVYVKNTVTGAESPHINVDSTASFVIPNQPAGDYYICWEGQAAVTAGCETGNIFATVADYVHTKRQSGQVPINPSAAVIYGIVSVPGTTPYNTEGNPNDPSSYQSFVSDPALIPGNSTCQHSDPFFGLDVTATVTLYDSANTQVGRTKADRDGNYVLAVPTPVDGNYNLVATCGPDTTFNYSQSVAISATGGEVNANLTLPTNREPVINSIGATTLSGTPVVGVPLGTRVRVTVNASDLDGDGLHYQWKSTAGTVVSTDSPIVNWRLPYQGKGLHFLYVEVTDNKGGFKSQRVAISTDDGIVSPAAGGSVPPPPPSDHFGDSERFLAVRGIDSKKSACEYYKSVGGVRNCDTSGNPVGWQITFDYWLERNDFNTGSNRTRPTRGELTAHFRNLADLNLVRDHHARKVSNRQIAYYVCNYAKATGAVPDANLVACVAMEYSITPGQNDGKPFTKYYTFGPAGDLYLSVNLDGRGEKFMPGTCSACHGGDNYFGHFPETGSGAHDGNIGAYMMPFDLDNYEYDPLLPREAQEDNVRKLNLMIKLTDPTPVMRQLIDGWYPNGDVTGVLGKQVSEFVPPGWNENLDTSLPKTDRINPLTTVNYTYNASDLYLKVVKPYCRLCHVAMGTPVALDFSRFNPLTVDDLSTPPDDTLGAFNDNYTNDTGDDVYDTVCNGDTFYPNSLLKSSPDKSMPNAKQTFDRFWKDPAAVNILSNYMLTDFYTDPTDSTNTPFPSESYLDLVGDPTVSPPNPILPSDYCLRPF